MKARTGIPKILVVQTTANGAGQEKVQGILKYAQTFGPWNVRLVQGVVEELAPRTKAEWRSYDGIIVGQQFLQYADDVMVSRRPVVLIDPLDTVVRKGLYFSKFPMTQEDSEGVGRLAAEYYLGKIADGKWHFAYVGMPKAFSWSLRQQKGFVETLKARGVECEVFASGRNLLPEEDARTLAHWLRNLPKPTAVFAANDVRAYQVAATCATLGLAVPRDVAILGVDDDILFCEGAEPHISSIREDCLKCGYMAAKMMDDLVNGRKLETKKFIYGPIRVIERASTDFSLLKFPRVVQQIRDAIRINVGSPVTIAELLDSIHVPRRYGEIAFRKAVGRSILDEMRDVRLALAEKLLAETRLPLDVVAFRCGVTTEKSLWRLFKERHGMTPSEFRATSR